MRIVDDDHVGAPASEAATKRRNEDAAAASAKIGDFPVAPLEPRREKSFEPG